jgi:hypothetical protein
MLTADDLEPAFVGGLFLSAGGSGRRSDARSAASTSRSLSLPMPDPCHL